MRNKERKRDKESFYWNDDFSPDLADVWTDHFSHDALRESVSCHLQFSWSLIKVVWSLILFLHSENWVIPSVYHCWWLFAPPGKPLTLLQLHLIHHWSMRNRHAFFPVQSFLSLLSIANQATCCTIHCSARNQTPDQCVLTLSGAGEGPFMGER